MQSNAGYMDMLNDRVYVAEENEKPYVGVVLVCTDVHCDVGRPGSKVFGSRFILVRGGWSLYVDPRYRVELT